MIGVVEPEEQMSTDGTHDGVSSERNPDFVMMMMMTVVSVSVGFTGLLVRCLR